MTKLQYKRNPSNPNFFNTLSNDIFMMILYCDPNDIATSFNFEGNIYITAESNYMLVITLTCSPDGSTLIATLSENRSSTNFVTNDIEPSKILSVTVITMQDRTPGIASLLESMLVHLFKYYDMSIDFSTTGSIEELDEILSIEPDTFHAVNIQSDFKTDGKFNSKSSIAKTLRSKIFKYNKTSTKLIEDHTDNVIKALSKGSNYVIMVLSNNATVCGDDVSMRCAVHIFKHRQSGRNGYVLSLSGRVEKVDTTLFFDIDLLRRYILGIFEQELQIYDKLGPINKSIRTLETTYDYRYQIR